MSNLADRVAALEPGHLRHDKQWERHEKQLESIRNLLDRGTRLVLQLAAGQRRLQASVTELTNSLKRGSNGHTKRKLALQ
jgi:hypothetical protein